MSYSPAEIKAAGLDDFRVFFKNLWVMNLGLPEPTPIQNDIGHYLQHGPRRRIIMGFRGVAKSWMTAAYVLWLLFLNPDIKILVVSASQPLADDFTKFVQRLIDEVPMLQHLKPRAGNFSSVSKFEVGPAKASKDPSVKSAGITGQITGNRADVIIADDIEIPKNSMTHLMRERLSEQVKEFDAILKPGGQVIFLGTPQVEATLYFRLTKRGYEARVWPSEVPSDLNIYQGRLSPFVHRLVELGATPGTPTEPTRFSEMELRERRISYGTAGYALQFLLDPTPADAERNPLKTRDLVLMDVDGDMGYSRVVWAGDRLHTVQDLESGGYDGDCFQSPAWLSPEMQPWQGIVMAIDPSGKGKDETGTAIVRHLNGQLYLVDSGGHLDGYSERTLDRIAERAILHKVNLILVEDNFGGGMFRELLRAALQKVYDRMALAAKEGKGPAPSHLPRMADDDDWNGWSSAQKEVRILNTLQPLIENHRLSITRRVVAADMLLDPEYSLIFQMTRMTREKGCLAHEDRLDALAMACGYFEQRMSREQSRALVDEKQSRIDEEIKKFLEGTGQQVGRHHRSVSTYSPSSSAQSSDWTTRLRR